MTLDLNLIQKRLRPRSVLALNVESGTVAVSLVWLGMSAECSFSIDLPDWLDDPQKAGVELASALDGAGIRERRCVVCMPSSWALSASADLPEVNAEDLRGYFELRAEREFSISGLRLAHSPYFLPGGVRRATLVGITAKRMEALEKMLAIAGCRPVSISLALDGCLASEEPTLHFLSKPGQTDVVVSIGGGVALLRTMPGGAEQAALAREIRITLGRLPEALRQALRHARLVGPPIPGLREVLEPLGIVEIDEEPQAVAGQSAVECAELFLREAPVPFEFVVPEVNRWPAKMARFNTRSSRKIAVGVAALFLLLVTVFTVRSHMESALQAEWAGMRNSVTDLEGLQQNIRRFRPWFGGAPRKLKALETLFAAFPERGEVWSRSVQIAPFLEKSGGSSRMVPSLEASKVTVSGFARNQSALMVLQDRLRKASGVSELQLQQLRGNNPIQFSLTFKWEPKHEI